MDEDEVKRAVARAESEARRIATEITAAAALARTFNSEAELTAWTESASTLFEDIQDEATREIFARQMDHMLSRVRAQFAANKKWRSEQQDPKP